MTLQEECDLLRPAAVGLASIRIWCGIWFLISSYLKCPFSGLSQWEFPEQLARRATALANEGAFSFYRPVLSFVHDHPTFSTTGLGILEAIIGSLLVLGLFTRTTAACGVLVSINYWLATGRLGAGSVGLFMTLCVCLMCLILGDGGRFYGLDRLRRGTSSPPRIPPLPPSI